MIGMDLTQIIFVYVVPSIFTVALVALFYIYSKMSPSTKTLLKNDLGMLKKKEWALRADCDYVCSIQTYDYKSPGMLVKKRKKQADERYIFGLPVDASMNPEESKQIMRVEKHILTPYTLNGKPLHMVHSAVGIVTNPRVLTALSNSPYLTEAEEKNEINMELPEREIDDNGKTSRLDFTALIPFNLDAITKWFQKHWPDIFLENLDWTGYTRGVKETKGESKDMIKIMIIGAIVACFMIGGVVIAGKIFGG